MLIFTVGDGALDGNPKTHFAHFEDPYDGNPKTRFAHFEDPYGYNPINDNLQR